MYSTFEDLSFEIHDTFGFGTRAKMFFPNGYGISVITGKYAYTKGPDQFEAAVLKGDSEEWGLTYVTPVTNDVIGYLSPQDVTEVMRQIQDLPEE